MSGSFGEDVVSAGSAGSLWDVLVGREKCRRFSDQDGGRETGGWWCYGLVALWLVTYGGSVYTHVLVFHRAAAKDKAAAGAVLALHLATMLLGLYVLYRHCERCDGWMGLLVAVLLLAVCVGASAVLYPGYDATLRSLVTSSPSSEDA